MLKKLSALGRTSQRAGKNQNSKEKSKDKWQKKADEYLDGWQRSKADFTNYKKRQVDLMSDFKKYSQTEFILEILPVLDSFNQALKYIPEEEKKSNWVMGMLGIKMQFDKFLQEHGVEEIKSIGEKFDPNLHEGIGVEESDEKSNTIIEEVQKGYTLNNRVIRAAKVKIAK